eukprot:5886465-Amphidinium_carterae.1
MPLIDLGPLVAIRELDTVRVPSAKEVLGPPLGREVNQDLNALNPQNPTATLACTQRVGGL